MASAPVNNRENERWSGSGAGELPEVIAIPMVGEGVRVVPVSTDSTLVHREEHIEMIKRLEQLLCDQTLPAELRQQYQNELEVETAKLRHGHGQMVRLHSGQGGSPLVTYW